LLELNPSEVEPVYPIDIWVRFGKYDFSDSCLNNLFRALSARKRSCVKDTSPCSLARCQNGPYFRVYSRAPIHRPIRKEKAFEIGLGTFVCASFAAPGRTSLKNYFLAANRTASTLFGQSFEVFVSHDVSKALLMVLGLLDAGIRSKRVLVVPGAYDLPVWVGDDSPNMTLDAF
jgi:hypothetical protein